MSRDHAERKKPKPGGVSALTVVLILGGVGLVLGLTLCCGVAGMFIYRGRIGGSGADLSPQNVQKVALGMTLTQVESILGKGRVATQSDFDEVDRRAARFRTGSSVQRMPGATTYVWRSGTSWFFAHFDSQNKLVGMHQVSSSR